MSVATSTLRVNSFFWWKERTHSISFHQGNVELFIYWSFLRTGSIVLERIFRMVIWTNCLLFCRLVHFFHFFILFWHSKFVSLRVFQTRLYTFFFFAFFIFSLFTLTEIVILNRNYFTSYWSECLLVSVLFFFYIFFCNFERTENTSNNFQLQQYLVHIFLYLFFNQT